MFLVYPSVVQLVRSPEPFGFGGNAIDVAHVQLPFMIMFLVFASVSALVIRKIGNVKPTILGGIISVIGAFGLLAFHSTEFQVSTNLAIIATGLALTSTAVWNILVTSSPKEFTGISDPYEAPTDAEVTINTGERSPEEAAQEIVLHLEREGFFGVPGAGE